MIKLFPIFLVVLGCAMTNTRAESPIDFSSSDNLKAVYDAGFRPWRSTMFSCIVTDKTVSVILPENAQFSLPAQVATFSVLAGDQMSRIELDGEVMSTDEAIAKLRELCSVLNLPTTGFDQFASTFADRAPRSTTWNTRGLKGDVSIFVSTDRLDFIDHLGAQVYVTLDWKRKGIPPKFPTTPMTPPTGYENESMAQPPPSYNPTPHQPYHSPEEYKAMIDKAKTEGTNAIPPAPNLPSQFPPPTAPHVQPPSETGIPWWLYGIIVLSLAIMVGLWYRSRLKK
jgi:hypothetical protein